MNRIVKWGLTGIAVTAATLTALHLSGYPLPGLPAHDAPVAHVGEPPSRIDVQIPAITVAKAETVPLVDTVLVTGTLVPREEILVAPEVEGLRVTDIKADIGDAVAKGDTLATLERTQLETQLAQNTAAIARADATIAQARSQINQAQAAVEEARAAFERAKPLRKSGFVSESVFDQREAAARTTAAQLVAAEDGLRLAEAGKKETQAQRREIEWRLGNTAVTAPRAGIVSRRNARIGGLASGGSTEPMFRIIADGEIELEAEVVEADLARIKVGQGATIEVAGAAEVEGKVRLVAPEVDRATRLGKVRIFIGRNPDLKIGAFGRARIVTARSRGIAVPAAAVLYSGNGALVQRVSGDTISTVAVKTGLRTDARVEIRHGLSEGDLVVAKAGTFLRDGDKVRTILPDPRVSEAHR